MTRILFSNNVVRKMPLSTMTIGRMVLSRITLIRTTLSTPRLSWGARYITGDSLLVARAEFSTLS